MRFLLDTDICIYVINQRPERVIRRFLEHEDDGLAISSITAAELHFGVAKTGSRRNITALEHFLEPLAILEFDGEAARAYGTLRASLEKKGTPIGPLDTLIAAQAVSRRLVLVTNNLREFRRVPGLDVESWA